ncbi:MAG: C40 family peptidase [Porphyromonadaceae bacterium]|nr:C40 family peptidase [Porphyromonadaceae bacterium]
MNKRYALAFRLSLLVLLSLPMVSCAARNRETKSKLRTSPSVQTSPTAQASSPHETPLEDALSQLIRSGERLLGKPYRSRGIAPWPLDCSGYVSYLYQKLGVSIPRSSAALSTFVKKVAEARPGDLVFFKGRNASSSRVGHVALVVDNKDGDLTIMHSTNSRGIIKHKLKSHRYFNKRFLYVGRLPWMAEMLRKEGIETPQTSNTPIRPAAVRPPLPWLEPISNLWSAITPPPTSQVQ